MSKSTQLSWTNNQVKAMKLKMNRPTKKHKTTEKLGITAKGKKDLYQCNYDYKASPDFIHRSW